jgi:choline-phosphate cytidylyltransferase
MLLLIKSGKIGDVVSVDATCTTLRVVQDYSEENLKKVWGSITAWGPTALLPVFQILGTEYDDCDMITHFEDKSNNYDNFTKISFRYKNAVASIKVGTGVKSEGELIISGTKGYIYVPAPWWKMDYFEIRYENVADNRRYFYQLEGEGIRNELVCFSRAISKGKEDLYIERHISKAIIEIMNSFINEKNYHTI